MTPYTQAELRANLEVAILEELENCGMHGLADMFDNGYNGTSKGIRIALNDAHDALDEAFKKISRLAVRTGHIAKENK
jgi:hypothetical protein